MRSTMCLLLIVAVSPYLSYPQDQARLTVFRQEQSNYLFIVQHQFHARYGIEIPLTYRFIVADGPAGLVVKKKSSSSESWTEIPEKHAGEMFNEGDAMRYDTRQSCVFVSVAFDRSDSLFLRLTDRDGRSVNATYAGITKYFDNRQAAVTISADDWFSEFDGQFQLLLDLFRSYGLPVTVGVTTGSLPRASWDVIQGQLDKGSLELASHSRSHPFTPYDDPSGEVLGSMKDIITNVRLPKPYAANGTQHVYVWLAPSGDYDATVDSLLTVADYLVPRLYLNLPVTPHRVFTFGDTGLSRWNTARNHFDPVLPTVELGAPYWGGGDTSLSSLNSLFDTVIAKGGVYHPMWHPQGIFEDREKPYLLNHLSHISRKENLWYANLGPLYLYHMIQEENATGVTRVTAPDTGLLPEPLVRVRHSPASPYSAISVLAALSKNTFVSIVVYDSLNRSVVSRVNTFLDKGTYEFVFDAGFLPSGTYTCQSIFGSELFSRGVVLPEY